MAILVCPLSRVVDLVDTRRPSHVVSLLDPASPFPVGAGIHPERHLRVELHDISEPSAGLTHADEKHLEMIIAFVERWPREDPILIHCYAGISRSSATAFITACIHNPDCDEEEIAIGMRRASVNASPNRRIVALADAMLGRMGRMSRAVAAMGPAALSWPQITENTPFEIASVMRGAP
jgi:predicted protein tyrosine phosphatase